MSQNDIVSKRSFFAISPGGVLAVFVSGGLSAMAFSAAIFGEWGVAINFAVVAALGLHAAMSNAKEPMQSATYRMGRFGLRTAEFLDEMTVCEPKSDRK